MSGHSKWSQIKRQKGSSDLKRGLTFTKLANAISISVREGNDNVDPETNFRLRLLVDKAKQANMPKDNILRAIERGKKGSGNGSMFEEIMYEGYGPNGIAFLIQAATDNKTRTTQEVKNIFEKSGGNLSSPGSVIFLFKKIGLIKINNSKKTDEIMMIAIDLGIEDIEKNNDFIFIYTKCDLLLQIKKLLEQKGIEITEAEEIMKPINPIKIDSLDLLQKIIFLMEKFENNNDIQKVYTNVNIQN